MVEQIERSDDMLFYLSYVENKEPRVDTKKVRLGDQIDLSFCIGLVDVISWK